MSSTSLIKGQLVTVIKRFKFEELESAVMPIFPEVTWTRLRTKLVRNHKNFTVPNAVHVIEDVLDNIDLRRKELADRLTMLEVIDISRHDNRKIWYTYELQGLSKALRQPEGHELQENIKERFHVADFDMIVKVVTYNNVMFIYVKEEEEKKKRKRQKKRTTPTFFALFLEHKYFFCSKKLVPLYYVKVIANSLGYKNGKPIKLMGRDLRSLIKLLWNKQQGVLHTENINQPLVYQPSKPIVSDNGVDYTQNKRRKKYAEQCFGKDPPTLEMLVIEGPEEPIRHEGIASKLSTGTIRMSWEFRSDNIARFLTTLVERHAFMLPLPDYVSNIMMTGKNKLKLQTD